MPTKDPTMPTTARPVTGETITDDQIRALRAAIMADWRKRGKTTSWPEGKRLLHDITIALTDRRAMAMQIDDVRAGVRAARERCADAINARAKDVP
jgi:hypothetical protein